MNTTKYAVGFSFATVLGVCTMAPVSAAPVVSIAAALKSAIENPIAEARYVRRGVARRGVARAAVATGVGVAAAASYRYAAGYPSYGYGASYNYGYPYSGSYGYAPSSYSYNYGYAPDSGITVTTTATRRRLWCPACGSRCGATRGLSSLISNKLTSDRRVQKPRPAEPTLKQRC